MINDSERREIAARLGELADANEGCLGMDRVNRVLRDGQAILGTSGLASVADVLRRHADLIEPEPERTCNVEKIHICPDVMRAIGVPCATVSISKATSRIIAQTAEQR